jgi:aryl-alcohol dehydrogenase
VGTAATAPRAGPVYCATFFDRNFGGRRLDGSTAFTLDGCPVSSHFFGQSSFASHANVPVSSIVQVPASAPLALLAPLGCGIQTGAEAVLNSLRPPVGSTIAIFGAGAVGLSAVPAAKIAACTTIIAVDRNVGRLDLARALGATHIVHAGSEDVVSHLREITAGGARYALETTGVPAVFTDMTKSLGVLGRAGIVGATALGTTADLDIGSLLPVGISLSMIVEGDSVPASFIPRLIGLWESGLFPFDELVTTYPFDQINTAFKDSADGAAVKPVVVF